MTGATPLERLARGEQALPEEPEYAPELYWLWLAGLLRPGCPQAGRVLDEYGSARAVYEERSDLARFARAAGRTAAQRMAEWEKTPADYEKIRQDCNDRQIRIVTFEDPAYPLALSRISDPPLVLYCTGDPQWLAAPHTVGVVGSRTPTAYGVQAAARLGRELAQGGAVIVSGLADGLDSESHKAAVACHAPTVGVLGVPIDRTYPAGNAGLRRQVEACGTVISEYAPVGRATYSAAFLQRNRIIAALSRALLVVEARRRSGTMSTVGHALRYGRPVYAVPGSIFSPLSEGTNALLQDGSARPAIDGQVLLQAVGLAAGEMPAPEACPPRQEAPLSPNARKALACIGATPVGLTALAEASGLSMGALLGALTALEVAGRITPLPGRQYILK